MKKEHKEILGYITTMMVKHPELRFTQILYALGISKAIPDEKTGLAVVVDNFYWEDKKVLEEIKKSQDSEKDSEKSKEKSS